ncbi:hypothetical protein [Rathayibacter sp. VKM Ac-2928]|uniref:hypothetical protein n=1 Tax=Rathayibacter sp. VKM Ac-2928 TaxID=2929479 RepID=UPI001FB30CB4|nr:hypothetical protein [Rathayibacter sp. VKM Ac-2928]MCJ1682343.1 hypothetical protein [Rathayibacter sp. VKM Ac-2928]
MSDEERTPIPEELREEWKHLALISRALGHALAARPTPLPGSSLEFADDLYQSEVVSQWSREMLNSAIDHFQAWADVFVPLQQFEGQVVIHRGHRWYFTFVRAILEGASQSLWLLSVPNAQVAVARLLVAVRHDLEEERKALALLGMDTSSVVERLARHAAAAEAFAEFETPRAKLPAMVDLIANAARKEGLSPDRLVADWRLSSAAAHGKLWARPHLQVAVKSAEWRPGQYLQSTHVDLQALADMLNRASSLLNRAVLRYLTHSGEANPLPLMRDAILKSARATPTVGGPEALEKLIATLPKLPS